MIREADGQNSLSSPSERQPFSIGRITAGNRNDFSSVAPGRVRVDYVVRGHLSVMLGGRRAELGESALLLAAPNTPGKILASCGMEFELFQLEFLPDFSPGKADTSCVAAYLQDKCRFWIEDVGGGESQFELEELLREIQNEFAAQREGYLTALQADIIRMLVFFHRLRKKNSAGAKKSIADSPRKSILCSLQYIREHFTEPISLGQMARLVMLSSSYYSHLFKMATQKTFVEYINLLRIRRAMDLLQDTDGLIVDICFECGFQNVNHFNRMFKSIVGLSPREYRKRRSEALVAAS